MLERDPKRRITLFEILDHPWVNTESIIYTEAMKRQMFISHTVDDSMDMEIVTELASMGIDVHELRDALMNGVYNEITGKLFINMVSALSSQVSSGIKSME